MKPITLIFLAITIQVFGKTRPGEKSGSIQFDRLEWQSLREDLNYATYPAEKAVKNSDSTGNFGVTQENRSEGFIPERLQGPLKIMAVIFIALLALIFLVLFFRSPYFLALLQRDPKAENDVFDWVDALKEEGDLIGANLDEGLTEAMKIADYRMAIRLNYLQILQALAKKKMISWGIDKTNEKYIRELEEQVLKSRLTGLTVVFEKIWYGNREIGREDYEQLVKAFHTMLQDINSRD